MKIMKQKSIFQLFAIANVLVLMASFFVTSNMSAMFDPMDVDLIKMSLDDTNFKSILISNNEGCSVEVTSQIGGFIDWEWTILPGQGVYVPVSYENKRATIIIRYECIEQKYEDLVSGKEYNLSSVISLRAVQ